MRYELPTGKKVNIPDNEIDLFMKNHKMTKDEAIHLWLCDNDYEEDETEKELTAKAKTIRIDHDAHKLKTADSEKKKRTVKISDEKVAFFTDLKDYLSDMGYEFEVKTENKLIEVTIGEKTFKLDLIEKRKPKK